MLLGCKASTNQLLWKPSVCPGTLPSSEAFNLKIPIRQQVNNIGSCCIYSNIYIYIYTAIYSKKICCYIYIYSSSRSIHAVPATRPSLCRWDLRVSYFKTHNTLAPASFKRLGINPGAPLRIRRPINSIISGINRHVGTLRETFRGQ